MSEEYLPIKKSLGYKEVSSALMEVFSINLGDLPIREGEYENFTFSFTYKGCDMNISITSTEKNKQFEYGEGGHFSISLPNPKYPNNSFLKNIYFHNLLSDEVLINDVKYAFGKKTGSIKRALITLKNYLDSECNKNLGD